MKETTHQAFDNYGNAVYEIHKLPDFPPVFTSTEPRIKVSPYTKFDKIHRKHKKK